MKIIQSTVERLLYIALALVFIVAAIGAFGAIYNSNKLTMQQKQFHADNISLLNTIKKNQAIQTTATKDYIACLLKINPQGNLPAQEQVCFDEVPQVK